MFEILLFVLALISGATAAVVGFGIGSMLTPLLATSVGMSAAVAAVTVPHAIATAVRCWRLRQSIDREVLLRFGLLSAAGGLAGALAYSRLGSDALTRVLGGLLLLTAAAQLTGWLSAGIRAVGSWAGSDSHPDSSAASPGTRADCDRRR